MSGAEKSIETRAEEAKEEAHPMVLNSVEEEDQKYLSSDDEFDANRIGNVPLEWYEDYDHIGYDVSGKPIEKGTGKQGMDAIDRLIASHDDPMFRRSIFDERNNETIVLTNRELNLVRRMVDCKFVNETSTFEAEPDYNPYFSSKIMKTPLRYDQIEPKRRFIPSKGEKMKVIKIIRGIREGRIKLDRDHKLEDQESLYLMWDDSGYVKGYHFDRLLMNRKKRHIAAPKVEKPGHELSYHPPPEYLFNEEEEKTYEELYEEDKDKIVKPVDFAKMRYIPAYQNIIREQFERCLDLYRCTRVKKDRLKIDPESLVPKLPQPKQLRPFPNVLALSFFGHSARVISISVSPNGELLASCDVTGAVRIWEVETARCLEQIDMLKTFQKHVNAATVEVKVTKLRFNPVFNLLSVSCGTLVLIFDVGGLLRAKDDLSAEKTTSQFFSKSQVAETSAEKQVDEEKVSDEKKNGSAKGKSASKRIVHSKWRIATREGGSSSSIRKFIVVELLDPHAQSMTDFCWHPKGFYLVTAVNSASKKRYGQVLIHHIAKQETKRLFGTSHPVTKLDVQKVCFHPAKPMLYVATKQAVFCQDLVKKNLVKRLKSGTTWISSLAVHSSGDHVLVGGFDHAVNWFDIDLKDSPFRSMKFHHQSVRSVAYHRRYPLMASGADDGSVHVFHARVFSDLIRDPLIVPVKSLKAHYGSREVGVSEIMFHPTQPWLFSCGGDKNIHLFQNIP